MLNKMICNSVKWIGQNAFAVTVSLILPIVYKNSFKMCTKFCGTISRSTGAKYELIVVKLNRNNVSKFIDFAGLASMMKLDPFVFTSLFSAGTIVSSSFFFFTVFVSEMHKMRSLFRTLFLSLSQEKLNNSNR